MFQNREVHVCIPVSAVVLGQKCLEYNLFVQLAVFQCFGFLQITNKKYTNHTLHLNDSLSKEADWLPGCIGWSGGRATRKTAKGEASIIAFETMRTRSLKTSS